MNFDFNLILVPLTLVLFIIWVLDKLVLKQRKTQGKGNESFLVRNSYELFPVVLIILLLRAFVFEPFIIPSSSMVPTLYTGDFILVNKFTYGLRLPLANTKVVPIGAPEHGDVVVFRYPQDNKTYYVKRVVGLPGDTLNYDNGVLSINGTKLKTQPSDYHPDKTLTSQLNSGVVMLNGEKLPEDQAIMLSNQEESDAHYYQESQEKHQYNVRYLDSFEGSRDAPFLVANSPDVSHSAGKHWQITVPEGQYFMMGDNRDRSADSRYWGFVPEANLVGKASYIWMHKMPGLQKPSFSRNRSID